MNKKKLVVAVFGYEINLCPTRGQRRFMNIIHINTIFVDLNEIDNDEENQLVEGEVELEELAPLTTGDDNLGEVVTERTGEDDSVEVVWKGTGKEDLEEVVTVN